MKVASEAKYKGVVLVNKLLFQPHVSRLKAKLCRTADIYASLNAILILAACCNFIAPIFTVTLQMKFNNGAQSTNFI